MSLRDYFAARAMNSIARQEGRWQGVDWAKGIATDAYELADAMMRARAQNT